MDNRKKIYAVIVLVAIIAFILFGIYGCGDNYNLPDEGERVEIYLEEPQGVLHHHCPDSAFMLVADDVLAVFNGTTLEEVFTVDSIDLTSAEALTRRIWSSSSDSMLCDQAEWRAWYATPTEEFKIRCKEIFQPYILAADTCQ